jgi:hypothetical protein
VGLSVHLLGTCSVELGGIRRPPPKGRKVWAVLAYLLANRRPVSRDHLAELLFGDADDPLGALRWSHYYSVFWVTPRSLSLLERPERDIEALEETRCANQHPTSIDGYADAIARNVLEILDGCIGRYPAALEANDAFIEHVADRIAACERPEMQQQHR